MKGRKRFEAAIVRAMTSHILPAFEEDMKEMGAALRNEIFNLEGPRTISRRPTPKERFHGKVFRGFSEIQKSVEALDDIAFYAGRFPYRKTRVTRERHLQFLVEVYLSEVYLLRERLVAYLKAVERQYKGHESLGAVLTRCRSVLEAVVSSLEGVVRVRGAHVHEFRFTDPDISRLGTIALLSQGDDEISRIMRAFFRLEYATVRKKWRRTLLKNNEAVRVLLDTFFENLHTLMFERTTQELRLPKGMET